MSIESQVGCLAEPSAAADGGRDRRFSKFKALGAAAAAELGRSAVEGFRVAIVDTLIHRGPDRHVESWLPMDEVLRRVTARFPLAVIDRERGDQRVIAEADKLEELSSPTSVLVELHRKMIGRVAYVTIREDDDGPQF